VRNPSAVVVIVSIYLFAALFELPSIRKRGLNDLMLYSLLMLLGLTLNVLAALGVRFPSVSDGITAVIRGWTGR